MHNIIKKSTTKSYRKKAISILVGLTLITPSIAYSNPQGGKVVSGSATITQESSTKLNINQHTNKAIINWKTFDIATTEHTQFYQPSTSSLGLNRVVGSVDPSKILGQLTANGRLFLVNPNGVVFGRNSKIDVASLIASTHDIKNEDFMAGRLNFNIPGNPKASIINQGSISVADKGLVAFVAPGVQNSGVITARLGKVQLASANGFTLDLYGDELISLMVDEKIAEYALDADGNSMDSLVDNTGKISADGGYVLLTADAARDVVNKVVNSSGVIEARSVEQQNGEIVLHGGDYGVVSVSGSLDATGEKDGETGGKATVTGEKVSLLAGANIDASGQNGGGKVLIGGDYLGGNPEPEKIVKFNIVMEEEDIATAYFTYVDEAATINADALSNGAGGKVVVWADDTARVYGNISARGGATRGDGGFVETSGKQSLDITGIRVDASAMDGIAGTWLLDPADYTVDDSAADAIMKALNNGTNHSIVADNSVNITSDITKSSGGDAYFNIYSYFIYQNQGADVTSGAGKLHVLYDATDRVWIGRGNVGLESNIASNGGNITFHGPNFVGINGVIDAGAGNILVKAENKEPTGVDKGIWIFGESILRGGTVELVTKDTLRKDQSKIIAGLVETKTLGQIEALQESLDIFKQFKQANKIVECIGDVANIDLRLIPNGTANKSIVKLTRSMTGLNKVQAKALSGVASRVDDIIKIITIAMNVIDLSRANNIGATAAATNTLCNNLAKIIGAKAGLSVGIAGGGLLGPVGAVIVGGAGSVGVGMAADAAYDKFLAQYVVEISADISRNRLRESTGRVLNI